MRRVQDLLGCGEVRAEGVQEDLRAELHRRGAAVETVSLLLGHATSKTTESYYCRKRQDAAIQEVNGIWSQKQNAVNKLIENGRYLSGYG